MHSSSIIHFWYSKYSDYTLAIGLVSFIAVSSYTVITVYQLFYSLIFPGHKSMFPCALAMIYWLHAPLDAVNPYGSGNNNHSTT